MERKIKKGYGLILGLQITTLVLFILTFIIGCFSIFENYYYMDIYLSFYEIPHSILLFISLIANIGLVSLTTIYRKNLKFDKKKYLISTLGASGFILIAIVLWILLVSSNFIRYLTEFGLLFYAGLILIALFTIWILIVTALKFLAEDVIIDLDLLEAQEEMMYRNPNNYYQNQLNNINNQQQTVNPLNEHEEMIKKIKELKILLNEGIITESEYEEKKASLNKKDTASNQEVDSEALNDLKMLYEEGLISKDEFEIKKALLNK